MRGLRTCFAVPLAKCLDKPSSNSAGMVPAFRASSNSFSDLCFSRAVNGASVPGVGTSIFEDLSERRAQTLCNHPKQDEGGILTLLYEKFLGEADFTHRCLITNHAPILIYLVVRRKLDVLTP